MFSRSHTLRKWKRNWLGRKMTEKKEKCAAWTAIGSSIFPHKRESASSTRNEIRMGISKEKRKNPPLEGGFADHVGTRGAPPLKKRNRKAGPSHLRRGAGSISFLPTNQKRTTDRGRKEKKKSCDSGVYWATKLLLGSTNPSFFAWPRAAQKGGGGLRKRRKEKKKGRYRPAGDSRSVPPRRPTKRSGSWGMCKPFQKWRFKKKTAGEILFSTVGGERCREFPGREQGGKCTRKRRE